MSGNSSRGQSKQQKCGGCTLCVRIALVLAVILIPWLVRVSYVQFGASTTPTNDFSPPADTASIKRERVEPVVSEQMKEPVKFVYNSGEPGDELKTPLPDRKNDVMRETLPKVPQKIVYDPSVTVHPVREPVLGPLPTNGTKPMLGKHTGRDAIFALAAGYPIDLFKFFVGSVRHFGYKDDIVLAVNTKDKIRRDVYAYLERTEVVAYGFDVDCEKKDSCRLRDDFLGYPDPRPYRPFANIRYALYEYWLHHYNPQSYILILDFRDTFFQADPFLSFGPFQQRQPKYELHVFAENHDVKTIGKCVFNSGWVGECFGRDALEPLKDEAVICSGSTLGSYMGISFYVRTMLASMDKVQCWRKNIESDQGYQSYLFYNHHFDTPNGVAQKFDQGHGVVNTIGAMNGFRVPAEKKGPLDTFWKIRDKDGFILNYDGTKSACVHQWDRFHDEVYPWLSRTFGNL